MNDLMKFGEAVDKYVRPESYPVAIKLVRDRSEIPKGIKTIKEELGVTQALCQGWGRARFNGSSVAMLKEDISCPIALITLGIADPPEDIELGDLYFEIFTPNIEAADHMARSIARLAPGKYAGVVMAPLHACDFQPDVVIVYGNPLQIQRFVIAALHREGGRFETTIFPPSVCSELIAPVMETGKCRFSIPCFGDRRFEYLARDEMVFSIPFARLEEIAEGLKYFYENGTKIPVRKALSHASDQMPVYRFLRSKL